MNADRSLWTPRSAILGLVFALAAVYPVPAQVPAKPQAAPAPALELKILHTHQMDAPLLVQTFYELYKDHVGKDMQVVNDPRANNRIFVRAQPADIKLLESFIRDADVPDERPSFGGVRVFPLKHVDPDPALQRIAQMVIESFAETSFAIDTQRKVLVVRGGPEVFQHMEKVLQSLDVPVATTREREVRVRIVWLVTGWQQDDSASPPPPDLKEAIAELAKVGFEKPRLIGQSMANVMLNRRFETVGTAVPEGHFYTWKTDGTVTEAPGGWLKLNISLRANDRAAIQRFEQGRTSIQEMGSAASPLFNITTEITTPPGHSVVLAMTPTGKQTSAFVVQVLPRPEPTDAKP